MKTLQEIQSEAQRLELLGREYRDEQARASVNLGAVEQSRILLPLSVRIERLPSGAVIAEHSLELRRRERYVDAAFEGGSLVFRLVEHETYPATAASGNELATDTVLTSGSVFDVLLAGYELMESERIAGLLAPYADRQEDNQNDPWSEDPDLVANVEAILETERLPASAKLRTKVEIAEFLEGRLEANELIENVIERQCAREERRMEWAERHEQKFAIDEP